MSVKHRKVLEIADAFSSSKRRIKRKTIKYLVVGLFIVLAIVMLLIFPSFVNWVVTYRGNTFDFLISENGLSKDNQWVGFIASYSGSIIGGIISGVLTLGGVLWTLKSGNRVEEIKNYPSKRKAILELHQLLDTANKRVEKYLNCDWNDNTNLLIPLKAAVDIYNEELESLTDIAMNINGYTLLSLLDFRERVLNLATEIDSGKMKSASKSEIETTFLGFKFYSVTIQNSIVKENQAYLNKMADIILNKKI